MTEPLLPRHPWVAALLFGSVATPAGVVLAWLAPRPLDAVIALPLVLLDVWAGEASLHDAPVVRVLALLVGIVLTWLFYVLVARVVLWRVGADGKGRDPRE
jgi:hypothetical protein